MAPSHSVENLSFDMTVPFMFEDPIAHWLHPE
jgi:hypothetical protein